MRTNFDYILIDTLYGYTMRFFLKNPENLRSTAMDLVFFIAPLIDMRRLRYFPVQAIGRFNRVVR